MMDFGLGKWNRFERMNIACPRYMVEEGMNRIEKAVKEWREGK